jgi:hypothetical protein
MISGVDDRLVNGRCRPRGIAAWLLQQVDCGALTEGAVAVSGFDPIGVGGARPTVWWAIAFLRKADAVRTIVAGRLRHEARLISVSRGVRAV